MCLEDFFQQHNTVVAIVGLSKNAGKTTFLNWILKKSAGEKIGVTTTGRDGEEIDTVTELKKPKVCLPANVYFTAFNDVSVKNASHLECIQKLPFRTIGKNLWLFKTLDNIETEIVGPANVSEQEKLIAIFHEIGCNTVFVDGSLDRKSICLSPIITDVVLIVGASGGTINELIKMAEKINTCTNGVSPLIDFDGGTPSVRTNGVSPLINNIYSNETTIINQLNQNPDYIYLPGMLTEPSWFKLKNHLLNYKGKIIFNHALNINISLNDLNTLCATKRVCSITKFPLSLVAINPFSVKNEHIDIDVLKNKIKNIFGDKVITFG